MKITRSLFAVLCLAVVTALVTSGQVAFAGTSEQNRAVGFSDACNGVSLSDGHTSAYIEGYNQGIDQCGHKGANSISGSDSASSSTSQSQSTGNTVNIHIDGAK